MIFWGAVAFSSLLLAVPQAAKPALESSSQSFETTLPTIIDQSWRVILSTHSEAPAKMKPSFRLVDGPAAPPLLDGDVIVFSKNYLLSLQTLALVLGHDAYTMEFGSFPKDAKDRTLWNRTPL